MPGNADTANLSGPNSDPKSMLSGGGNVLLGCLILVDLTSTAHRNRYRSLAEAETASDGVIRYISICLPGTISISVHVGWTSKRK